MKPPQRRIPIRLHFVLPLIVFNLVFFAFPISMILYFSVHSPEFVNAMPQTSSALGDWDGKAVPGEAVFSALVHDLRKSFAEKTLPDAAQRLNYELPGSQSMVMDTGRKAATLQPPYRETVIALDKRWGELEIWRVAASGSSRFTTHYLLSALDLRKHPDGTIHSAPESQRIYLTTLGRTIWMSLVVTLLCLAIGYPMACLIANSPGKWSNLFLLAVMIPFWMSLLVRTAAWVVLLQKKGLINDALVWLSLIDKPMQLIFNRIGVYVTMVHILLPFMILPLYSVMRGIPKEHLRAAASLGARPTAAYLSIYLPQTMPGIGAGALLVFVLSVGFYITPALVGGGSDQMLSYFIAQFAVQNANWGMASALALLLMVTAGLTIAIVARFTRATRVSMT